MFAHKYSSSKAQCFRRLFKPASFKALSTKINCSRGEIEIFVSGVNGLIFEVRNRSGIKKASICMSLDGMKKDPNLVYKLRIQGEYIKADQCKIKITDLGFGQIRQASYQTWQQVIQLERGDYHE